MARYPSVSVSLSSLTWLPQLPKKHFHPNVPPPVDARGVCGQGKLIAASLGVALASTGWRVGYFLR